MAEFRTFVPPKDNPPSPVEMQLPEKLTHEQLASYSRPPAPHAAPPSKFASLPAGYPVTAPQSPSATKGNIR